jgi:FkbM family methyltransferase
MKEILKKILALLNISLTRNQQYDAYTRKLLRLLLSPDSVCIDIGCHKGEILDLMLIHAPRGKKFGFEPIPSFYESLCEKYKSLSHVTISPLALFDEPGSTVFQHVLSAPAYSGIKKRRYDSDSVEIREINVEQARLDDVISPEIHVDLIKIDVEGAEFKVMKGAGRILSQSKPYVIFEFGLGAADYYGSTPDELFSFISVECSLKISTLKGFLRKTPALSAETFRNLYESGREYYFIAHP